MRTALRTTGNILIVLGLTVGLFVFYELEGTAAITEGKQKVLSTAFDSAARQNCRGGLAGFVPPGLKPPKEKKAVGRLRIPKIGLKVIVVQGATIDDMISGPGHYPNTPLPGQPGSVGIAGHSSGWTSPFQRIPKLKPGDLIYLDTTYCNFVYRVTGSKQIEARDVWVLKGQPGDKSPYKITLTTCVPIFTHQHRLAVWADQISPAGNF